MDIQWVDDRETPANMLQQGLKFAETIQYIMEMIIAMMINAIKIKIMILIIAFTTIMLFKRRVCEDFSRCTHIH